MSDRVLDVEHLTAGFDVGGRFLPAVRDVGFHIDAGETLCLVGESGCGKSVAALSLIRLLQPPARVAGGSIRLRGRELTALPEREMQRVRGAEIGFVFQEPMTALNPVLTVGRQIEEVLRVHGRADHRTARQRAVDLLASVSVPDPARRADHYPHELSGGLRQRALIAIALACEPAVLIADEPTTALDVTVQAQILELLKDLRQRLGLAVLLITHDFGVVAQMSDRVAVMYAGRIVEHADVKTLFADPKHPYTRGLLASMPGGPPGTRLQAIAGSVPGAAALPAGCSFVTRCPQRFDPCTTAHPGDSVFAGEHTVKCYLHGTAAESAEART